MIRGLLVLTDNRVADAGLRLVAGPLALALYVASLVLVGRGQ